MAELPSGTVSLLFSDVEGSTLLLSRLGPAYAEALDGQRKVLRKAWADHGGSELGTEGDSFMVVFPTAEAAVAAAAQAQRQLAEYPWPSGEQVRVRMGIHTGSPTVHGDGYLGMDVHRAARTAAAAHGGQVVVSEATAKLVERCLPEGVGVRDLGSHQLKDIAHPERLFQLVIEGLRSDFAPLKTLGASSSLPSPPTPLVGRDGELAELLGLLGSSQVRLVTLTGPGGSGKTRLAIALAQELVESFPDGVYFVPLAAVTDADVMWTDIAEVLDVPSEARTPPELFTYVAHRSALFVLDNLEQVAGADDVVAQLLNHAPHVVVLSTSRRALSVPGEHVHPVPPLELPDTDNPDKAGSSGAVQLFVQHATMVRPSFAPGGSIAADVTAICRRLDGLPLAIELAAARTRLLSPSALLARLDKALDIAATGKQGPARQKTLRDTIAWSYNLLTAQQQSFFCRLGVFAGGADLDAITTVTTDILDNAESIDLVAELVDASLATITEGIDGEPRVGMLETIRTYAIDQLTTIGDLDSGRERHAQNYSDLAQRLAPGLRDDRYLSAHDRFEAESDNIRAALTWALPEELSTGDRENRNSIGLRLCAALGPFWHTFGYLEPDGQRWLERAIERGSGNDSPELARCLGHMSRCVGNAQALDRARDYASAGITMSRRLDDSSCLAESLSLLGGLEWERGDALAARTAYQEALRIANDSGDNVQLHEALQGLAFCEVLEQHYDAAHQMLTKALAISRDLGDPYRILLDQHNSACSLRLAGRLEEAHQLIHAIIPTALRLNVPLNLMCLAEEYAATLVELGHHHAAIRLLAAADVVHELLNTPRNPEDQAEYVECIAKTQAALTPQEWDDTYASGKNTEIAHALTQAHAAHGPA